MKKLKYLLIVIAMILFVPFAVHAEDKYLNAGDTLKDIGTISHSYFSAGNTVNNEMAIDGILFTAGNVMTINGKSEYGFVAGNEISISGVILKDLFVAGNNVTISSKAEIGRDIYAAASSLVISTDINGSAFLTGEKVTLDGEHIKGDVSIEASAISFGEGLKIDGTLKYNKNTSVTGLDKITAAKIETYEDSDVKAEMTFRDYLREFLFSFAALLIVAFVINYFLPKAYLLDEDRITAADVFKRIGVGFLLLICIPIISIILFVTAVGLPLGLILLAAYVVMLYISTTFAAKLIGSLIMDFFKSAKESVYFELTIGILIIKLLALIPTVGGLIYFLGMLYGLGYIRKLFKEKRTAKE